MDFEYDPVKSEKNKEKHGIDFEEAKALWSDPDAIGFPAKFLEDEARFAILSKHKGKLWVGFYTERGHNLRITSVRRARKGEKKLYES